MEEVVLKSLSRGWSKAVLLRLKIYFKSDSICCYWNQTWHTRLPWKIRMVWIPTVFEWL